MTIKENNIKIYNEAPKKCKQCSEKLEYDKRNSTFCNSSCSAKFNNKLRTKFNSCSFCSKDIAIHKTYCNNKCQQEQQYFEKVQHWKSGKISSLGSSIRRYLTEKFTYKCSECDITEWNGKKIVLEVEHIDGNSTNNNEENLCFLCPNCHSQTDTYKGKNMGNGRHSRRERYKEGLSY